MDVSSCYPLFDLRIHALVLSKTKNCSFEENVDQPRPASVSRPFCPKRHWARILTTKWL